MTGGKHQELARLKREFLARGVGRVSEDVDLRLFSRWRIGGRGALLVEPSSTAAAITVIRLLAESGLPKLVIGDGSNLLFDDDGFDGVIVRIGGDMSAMRINGTTVWSEAGVWMPSFVRRLARDGLEGLQHAIGIPGTLGGLVIMNGGSQRKGIGSSIVTVRGCDQSGRLFERSQQECRFRYRGSTLQDDHLVVLETDFSFAEADPAALRREMIAIMADRRRKFPKNLPNCGSVFLSDPAMYSKIGPPGAAIERVGLKGRRAGGAQISPVHANFIVNLERAMSRDVLELVHLARHSVFAATGFWMDCEVRHVAPDGTTRPAHIAAEMAIGPAADPPTMRDTADMGPLKLDACP